MHFSHGVGSYGGAAAKAVLSGLFPMRFSGRCEFYARDHLLSEGYLVGLALVNSSGTATPTHKWWQAFVGQVAKACDRGRVVELDKGRSELGGVDGIRATCLLRGAVQFEDGQPTKILEDSDSWFVGECRDTMNDQTWDPPGR